MTGVSECSQQRGNLKDNGYISDSIQPAISRLNILRSCDGDRFSTFDSTNHFTRIRCTIWSLSGSDFRRTTTL
ncbi:hypothetical protein ABLB90_19875 [Photorhabdus bodei]|uniref:Uncharacterized protein n=1 Tax=Photorhabdus kayaii TaxID=230088 RepID=A0ABX0B0T3_9GAMM|nr:MULTISPECIES: hypothetical protein [Photorhabdus]MCC8376221.1 hypothetical protein [Photorhabdus bodei]MDB6369787.1 hypothetical protein [Photorhabdus bodei]NDL13424.1 hypothetical protein [Photorhabdus kayaii]NDL26723.1 hypothetical protein [Photorhabdus kayaii]